MTKNNELSVLSRRERDVLSLIALGHSNAMIAEELMVAETTVKSHVSNIFVKLGAKNRAEASLYAHRSGLVPIEPRASQIVGSDPSNGL